MNDMRGVILRLKKEKGFGFLRGEGQYFGTEYFFHMSDCRVEYASLEENMPVTFLPEKTDKGLRARNVRLAT